MTSFTISAIIIALALGYYLGTRNGQPFSDKQTAREARAKAHKVIEERITKRKDRILAQAREHERITNDDVEDMFCISDATARNYLNELEEEGKLTQHGATGRGVYYTPNN